MDAHTLPALRPAPFPRRGTRPGRAEIHFHILPGVDDGRRDLDESIHLACVACLAGTVTVVATRHVRGDLVADVADLPDRVREVREEPQEQETERQGPP